MLFRSALTTAANDSGSRMEVQAIEDVSDAAAVLDRVLETARSLDGLILSGYVEKNLMAELENARVPHVVFGHPMFETLSLETTHGQIVASDEVSMGELAVQALVRAGHSRISFVCEVVPRGLWTARWLRGYHVGLSELGRPVDPDLIKIAGVPMAGGEMALEQLLALDQPVTAHVIPDVRIAASFLAAARLRGKPIDPQCVVVGGLLALLRRYNLEHLPWIVTDHDQLAAVAVRQLRQI